MPAMNLSYYPVSCIVGSGASDFFIIIPPFGVNQANWVVFNVSAGTFTGSYATETQAMSGAQTAFTALAS